MYLLTLFLPRLEYKLFEARALVLFAAGLNSSPRMADAQILVSQDSSGLEGRLQGSTTWI